MVTLELIYEKARTLDAPKLEELYAFMAFLTRKDTKEAVHKKCFPVSQLEIPSQPSVYQGKPLSIAEMDAAIEFEAGVH
jgi:hypothetical protein